MFDLFHTRVYAEARQSALSAFTSHSATPTKLHKGQRGLKLTKWPLYSVRGSPELSVINVKTLQYDSYHRHTITRPAFIGCQYFCPNGTAS